MGSSQSVKWAIPLRFCLANAIVIASIGAIVCGGWPILLVLAAIYAMGGPVDEVIEDSGTGGGASSARWFGNANLYITLPLILILTYADLRLVAGTQFEQLTLLQAGFWNTQSLRWDHRFDIAAAAFLVGSCYAMFGATVAHELTHRAHPLARNSARALLALMWNTSFLIFHVHGHHRYVGTLRDPATARRGEHIFSFVARTVIGQSVEAYRHEIGRLRSAGLSPWSWHNRFLAGQLLSLAIIVASTLFAGWEGTLALLAAALTGRIVHEFVNYIQHYGLVRVEGAPIAARHTWDSYRALSNSMYYNLPQHSEHHLFASKPFWDLAQAPSAPVLPHGYMTMVLLALFPVLWRRAMAPCLADWDRRLANNAERAIIAERGWEGLC